LTVINIIIIKGGKIARVGIGGILEGRVAQAPKEKKHTNGSLHE
jgi:hypothetical protein